MRFGKHLLLTILFGAIIYSAGFANEAQAAPDSSDPIRLAVNDWTGAQVTTHVTGEALSRLGYKVDYVSAGYLPQFTALKDGEITISMEIWSSSVGEHWNKAKDSGQVVSLGNLGLEPVEGWLYPKHMTEICPGLPNWEVLQKPSCVEKLATAETFPKGRLLDYPADWGSSTKAVLEQFKLPYVAQPGGSEGALIAEFNASVAKKSPLVMMFWSPHWLTAENDVGWVEFPDGADGPIFPKNEVFKVAWVGAAKKWPKAISFVENFRLSNLDYATMIKAVDVDGKKLEEVAKTWVDENEDSWKQWWDTATN